MTAADPTLLRAMRARLARQDMPPANIDERPSAAEYAAMIAAIDAVVPPELPRGAGGAPRRCTLLP